MDADWNEKLEMRVNDGIVFLDVWEREVQTSSEPRLREPAVGGPNTDGRNEDRNDWRLRVTREIGVSGGRSFKVQFALGHVDSENGRRPLVLPAWEVCVEGIPWKRVNSFSDAGPEDEVYIVSGTDGGDGQLHIEFGDGKTGKRPRTGARVTASYAFGDGRAGNEDD